MFVTGSLNPQLHQMVHTVQSKLQISDNFACWDNLQFKFLYFKWQKSSSFNRSPGSAPVGADTESGLE